MASIAQDDDVQIWDGEEYAFVVLAIDQTVLQWENGRETLEGTDQLFIDPSFGRLSWPDGQTQIRKSGGFKGLSNLLPP